VFCQDNLREAAIGFFGFLLPVSNGKWPTGLWEAQTKKMALESNIKDALAERVESIFFNRMTKFHSNNGPIFRRV